MIYILDNFLPHNLFNALKEIKDFEEIKTPGKSFWISKPVSYTHLRAHET